ncbi:MAG: hypothetical protein LBV72_19940 [Tannerella sp.]|nr:hypothetical protein [Tannerella sp.]
MEKEIFDNEQKQNVQELFSILNLPGNNASNIQNPDELFNYLIENRKLILINEPKNEYETVNLFATIIQLFRKAGEKLPGYFDEPNICDDCEAMEIIELLNSYYNSEEERQIMILDNVRDKYIVCVVLKHQADKIYTLSFQTGIPLVRIDDF